MKKDVYVFPAIFDYADDGISIEFPDLPGCLPCGHSTEEALKNTREAMGLHLYGMESDKEEIPEPTEIKNIHLEKNQVVVMVEVYMPLRRDAIENAFERTNVTLPKWLKRKGEEEKVNFSLLLQNALKEHLGMKQK